MSTRESTVQIEVMPLLAGLFGSPGTERLILEQRIGEPETVRDVLRRLDAEHEGLYHELIDSSSGKLKGLVLLVLNDVMLDVSKALETTVRANDRLVLVPAIIGG